MRSFSPVHGGYRKNGSDNAPPSGNHSCGSPHTHPHPRGVSPGRGTHAACQHHPSPCAGQACSGRTTRRYACHGRRRYQRGPHHQTASRCTQDGEPRCCNSHATMSYITHQRNDKFQVTQVITRPDAVDAAIISIVRSLALVYNDATGGLPISEPVGRAGCTHVALWIDSGAVDIVAPTHAFTD